MKRIVYRWDLDKTYLRTEFDTVRDLLRTAFEPAKKKLTVPGAAALLREQRATNPAGIYILSGSPEQMRRVLEAKLRLDGVKWDSFTLKPSLHHLVRGRVRFLRDQIGYKLAALLTSRTQTASSADEICFGDDAEADAFIYSLYADICGERVGRDTLFAVLERARVYPEEIPRILRLAADVPRGDVCRRIFIHLDRVSSPDAFTELGRRVCPFYNYFQPALALLEEGALEPMSVLRVGAELVIEHGFTADALLASYTDLARRKQIGFSAVHELMLERPNLEQQLFGGATAVIRGFLSRLDEVEAEMGQVVVREDPHVGDEPHVIDYIALFSRDRARAHAAKKRAKMRL